MVSCCPKPPSRAALSSLGLVPGMGKEIGLLCILPNSRFKPKVSASAVRGGDCQCQQRSVSNLSSLLVTQSPPKGVTIPYRPKPSSSPVIFAGGQVRPLLCSWGVGWGEEKGEGGVLPSCHAASAHQPLCVPVTHAASSGGERLCLASASQSLLRAFLAELAEGWKRAEVGWGGSKRLVWGGGGAGKELWR